ncbi:MAG: hypothetical protein AAF772_13505, partial [Acidobacteriota bacterium]
VVEASTSGAYFDLGMVEQELCWTLQWQFPGGGALPTVDSKRRKGYPKSYKPCKALSDRLEKYDFEDPYNNPRPHEIVIPRPPR